MTILREWRAWASADRERAYPEHFSAHVKPALRSQPGFIEASLGRRDLAGGIIEYVVLSKWRDMDAVRAFAGANPDRAVVEPNAAAALKSFDAFVSHYRVVDETAANE